MIVARALHYAHGKRDLSPRRQARQCTFDAPYTARSCSISTWPSRPIRRSQAQAAMHGGTLPYMAPEQIEAFLNPDLWGKVGARADIYSLGLVLRELLTGQKPEVPDSAAPPARDSRRARSQATSRRLRPTIQSGDPLCPGSDRHEMSQLSLPTTGTPTPRHWRKTSIAS